MVRRHRPRTNKSPKVNVDFTDYFKKAHGRFVDFLEKAKSQSAIHVVTTENDRNKRHKPPLIRVEGLVDAFKLVAWQMQNASLLPVLAVVHIILRVRPRFEKSRSSTAPRESAAASSIEFQAPAEVWRFWADMW